MLKIRIIIGTEFRGMDSGWPVRYIGLIKELYKHYRLYIYAPGDTKLFQKYFPSAIVSGYSKFDIINIENKRHKNIKMLWDLFRPQPVIKKSGKYFSQELENIIGKDSLEYDCSIYFGLTAFVYYGRKDKSREIICDFCDSKLRHLNNKLNIEKSFKRKLSIFYDMIFIKRYKRNYIPKHINLMVISDEDKKFVKKVLKKNHIFTVPNGIESIEDTNSDSYLISKYSSKTILFLGSLDYQPNIESIIYSIENIWPTIRKNYPEAVFNIVGRNPNASLINKINSSQNINIYKDVASVRPFFMKAKLFLAPIFTGGGMKNKFLESLKYSTPIITTREGAAGINMISRKHCILCETADHFIEAVSEIFNLSKAEYHEYCNNCSILVKSYSWQNSLKIVQDEILNTSHLKKAVVEI